ncbi:MAG: T9SS type A sorting domain-containing protein [Bacteroidota bacterium]|nr:T9SS type A sorting domain-containing protein [Bacteroidota bacterium]
MGECGGDCAADADADGICDDVDDCVGELDACGICNGPGAIYECGCSDITEGDCDCDGNQLDALGVCGGDCAADADADGICDDVDDCVGELDACGICNGPGVIYECGCSDITEGDCDCDGNQLDALGVCGGDCAADADADGICDDEDDCVGELDACGICNGPGAIYDCGCSDIPEGDCDCDGNQLDALGVCGGDCAADADADGICDDVDDCVGELDACGICNGPGAIYECGCSDIPEGDCDCDGNQLDAIGDCGGDCVADNDADGICDNVDDCIGDFDICGVCNGPGAIYDCGCSDIPAEDCDCDGNQLDAIGECGGDCAADADADGICDDVDDCVGELDACGICNGPGAIYDCGCFDIPEGDCDCNGNQEDALNNCGGSCEEDADADGICDNADDCVGDYNSCGICNGDEALCECTDGDADGDGICDEIDDCVGQYDDCGVCNGMDFCELDDADFAGRTLTASSECGDDLIAPGLGESFDLLLQNNGLLAALSEAGNVIVGSWEINPCECAAELSFDALTCDPLAFEIDPFGLVQQLSPTNSCCLSITDLTEVWCSTTFLEELETQYVQCAEDLPTECDPTILLVDTCATGDVSCGILSSADEGFLTHNVTTAYGPGPDGVVRIYGLSAQSTCATDFFLEDPAKPLTLTRFGDSGTAMLTGGIVNDQDTLVKFDVEMYFEMEENAADWMANTPGAGLMTAWDCDVIPEALTVYSMNNSISRLTGTGSMEGQLFLNHMPVSESKRFQLGQGANNHNCEYGFAGWFGWTGNLDGEDVSGFAGDVIADLGAPSFQDTDCGGEFVTLTYTMMDPVTSTSTLYHQRWEVNDTIAPTFINAPMDTTIQWSDLHDDNCDWSIDVPCLDIIDNCGQWDPVYAGCNDPDDACGSVTFSEDIVALSPECPGNFVILRLWVADDENGNVAVHRQEITVVDTEGPSFEGTSPEIIISCGNINETEYVVNDCSGVVDVWFDQNLLTDTCTNPGGISRTYYAEDACGNISQFEQHVFIEDNDAPIVSGLNISLDCSMYSPDSLYPLEIQDCALNSWSLEEGIWVSSTTENWSSASDGLDTPVELTWEDSEALAGDSASCYRIERTVHAVDRCGNESSTTYSLNITDTEAPMLWAPTVLEMESELYQGNGALTVDAGQIGQILGGDQAQFSVNDDCSFDWGGVVEVVWVDSVSDLPHCLDLPGGSVFNRTYIATDACGNTASEEQLVRLVDTQAPVWVTPNITLDPVACQDATLDMVNDPTFMINEGGVFDNADTDLDITVTATLMSGGCVGVWFRQWVAIDDCNNIAFAEQYIPLYDNEAPEFTSLPDDTTVELDGSCAADTTPDGTGGYPEFTDNCDLCLDQNLPLEFEESEPVWLCAEGIGSYQIERSWSVTDHCGNTAQHVQTVTFVDVSAPLLAIPADYTAECNDEHPLEEATATDNCGNPAITMDVDTAFICPHTYTVSRTFTAVDECGNDTSLTQVITIQDTTAPELTIPADYTAECSDEHPLEDASATDNCGEVTIALATDTLDGDCLDNYKVTRTFTATDECGNSTTLMQTITIEDTTAPEFTSVPADYTAECDEELVYDAAAATDNCAMPAITEVRDTLDGDCPQSFTIVRTFTATDNCGNISVSQQSITVQDTTAPELTIPSDYTAECSDDHPLEYATASDNCGAVTIELDVDTLDGACAQAYTVTRTFTATDECGNETSATQTIVIEDTTAPLFVEALPADATVECDSVPAADILTATDNCQNVDVSFEETSEAGDCPNESIITRTWTVSDDCGNSNDHTQVLTVVDTTAPELSIPADYTAECSEAHPLEDASATDNCGDVTIELAVDTLDGDCDQAYTVTRTFTATDACGNETSATQTIVIEDTTAPLFVEALPADTTVECDSVTEPAILTATDNCQDVDVSFEEMTTAGDCTESFTITRVWSVADDCGNATSHTQIVEVVDTTAPTGIVEDQTMACDIYNADPSQEFGPGVTATDNCSDLIAIEFDGSEDVIVTLDENGNPVMDGCISIARTYTLTDACGNSSELVQMIHLVDNIAPTYDGPMEVTIPAHEYAEDGMYPPDANWELIDGTGDTPVWFMDNCSGHDTTIVMDLPLSGGCANQPHPLYWGETATYLRVLSFRDNCGNQNFAEIIINLVDDVPPVFDFVPADIEASCAADVVLEDPIVSDATDEELELVLVVDSVNHGCPNAYTLIRTWTVTDNCDNETTATQTVTVSDTTAPVLTIPSDYTAECNDAHPLEDAMATDNCGNVVVTMDVDTADGGCPGEYTVTRMFTATDLCGNETSATQTITIVDTTAPEFTYVPADYTAECNQEHPIEDAMASDACGAVTIDIETDTLDLDDECTGAYIVTRKFTATDECGLTTEAIQTITIEDTTAPDVWDAIDEIVECNGSGNEAQLNAWLDNHGGASAEDNCGAIEWSHDHVGLSGACAAAGATTVTFTATDDCGNFTTTTATFTVVDITTPEIVGDQEIDVACDIYSPDSAYATTHDVCGNVTFTWEDEPVSGGCTLPVAMFRRMYIATDECGNVDSLEQFVSIIDTIAPLLTVPADYTAECDDVLVYDDAFASDNCSGATITEMRDTVEGSCPQSFSIVRTFSAKDNCDNETVLTQTITVEDTTAPELTIPEDYTAECSDNHPLESASATDNCGDVVIELAVDTLDGACDQAYTVTRTFTATDECGNATTRTQTIVIEDTTSPEFVEALPVDLTVECDAIPVADVLTATDNCQGVEVLYEETQVAGDCANASTIFRTWTATDDCGNSTSHTQEMTVIDTTAPELTVPDGYTAECSAAHPLADAIATDNCGEVTIEVDADTSSVTCENTYVVTRIFTATDACGNVTVGQQVINIQDTTQPAFVETLPADTVVECSSIPAPAVLTATDNCGSVDVMFEEVESDIEDGCAHTYLLTRIWTVEDACGNTNSHTQTVEVDDTSSPLFMNLGLDNGEVVVVAYDDVYGNVTLPAIANPSASDNCSEVEPCDSAANAEANAMLADMLGLEETIAYLSSVEGTGLNNPFLTGGDWTTGVITTPEVMADGQTCDNNPVIHGVRMFNFAGGEYYTTESGSIELNEDGTVHVTMEARMVDDPDAVLMVNANFASLLTWDEWLDTPGPENYKSDCGLGDHMLWKYTTLLDGSSITGAGSLAGTHLELTHQPMNEYFGFQFGEGANNKNGNFGFSGWFYYNGTLVLDGDEGTQVMGSGDLFGDIDFMQDWSTTLTYCITDCVGNTSQFSYHIESSADVLNPLDEDGIQGEPEDAMPVAPKDLISVATLHPNPTSAQTLLVLDAKMNVAAKVVLLDMSGNLVLNIMDGMLYEAWNTTLTMNLQGVESGMYQIQITAKEFVTTKKLLVTD